MGTRKRRWSEQERRRDRWLVVGRLGSAVLLGTLALASRGALRSPEGVLGAALGAGLLGLASWRPEARRPVRGLVLLGDLAWVTLAALAAGRSEAGLTLLFPLVAFGSGISLGGVSGFGLSLLAGTGLIAVSRVLGGPGSGLTGIVIQGALVLVLGLVSSRVRSLILLRERALAHASKAMERMRLDTDSIVRDLASGVISVDASGRVVHLNRVAETTLGVDGTTARGCPMREVLGAGCRDLVDVLETGLADGAAVSRKELEIDRGGQPVPLGLGTTILHGRDDEVTGVAALFQDLTEIRKQEDEQKRRDRMAAVGELAAGIAHEIRNSILPVSGSVQLLTQELRPEGEQAKLFEVIERETDNIERFVSALLNYTRRRRLHPVEFDLARMASGLARELGLSRSDDPEVRVEGVPAPVIADEEQIRQLVRNLLVNAADATGSGGTIRIRTGVAGTGPWIEVEDSGPGIPEEERARVFQPFFTTKAGGTGLGLSIVSRIVEDHGGELTLSGGEIGGARFRVALPGDGGDGTAAAAA